LIDSKGQVLWAASYSAWGAVDKLHASAVSNPIRLQGQYEDGETGLYYNRYRYFDAWTGIFVGQDPMRLATGANLYWYAGSTTLLADPLGLSCTFDASTNKWLNRQTGHTQPAPIDLSDLVHNGRLDFADLQAFVTHHALTDNWRPSANFPSGGFRHEIATATHNTSIHGHGSNPNAVAHFPGSNAALGPTASITRQPTGGGSRENFRTDGTWGSFGSDPNGAHIPLDNSPY